MPDRIIRDELLESDRWLDLPGAEERLAYIILLLGADTLGNHEASQHRLAKAWADALNECSKERAEKILQSMVDLDLVRLYEVDSPGEHPVTKRYLHIPRYRQRLRYIKRLHPLSPWTTKEEKQALKFNSPGDSQAQTGIQSGASQVRTPEVSRSEVKRVEERGVEVRYLKPVATDEEIRAMREAERSNLNPNPISDNPSTSKPNGQTTDLPKEWWKDDPKTDQAGRALGIEAKRGELYRAYRTRLFAEIKRLKTHKE